MQIGLNVLDGLRNAAAAAHVASALASGVDVFVGPIGSSGSSWSVGFSSDAQPPPLPQGDSKLLESCLGKLSASLLRGAGDSAPPVSLSSGSGVIVWPPIVEMNQSMTSQRSLCSPAISLSTLRCSPQIHDSPGYSLDLDLPLPPCGYSGTLTHAAAPPSTVTFSGATWSAISESVGNASNLALTIIEWGVPPVDAAAPWSSPALSSERRLHRVKQYGATTPRRHLGTPALASVVENISAAHVDTLIGRGLDTHVTSISLVTENGTTVTSWSSRASDATAVFITIPYTAATLPVEGGASSSPATGLYALYVRQKLASPPPPPSLFYAHLLLSPSLVLTVCLPPHGCQSDVPGFGTECVTASKNRHACSRRAGGADFGSWTQCHCVGR